MPAVSSAWRSPGRDAMVVIAPIGASPPPQASGDVSQSRTRPIGAPGLVIVFTHAKHQRDALVVDAGRERWRTDGGP